MKTQLIVVAMFFLTTCSCSRKSSESPKDRGDAKVRDSNQVSNIADRTESGKNTPADQAAIVAAVRQNIQSAPIIKSKQIQVSYEHGTIKLKGRVGTDDEVIAAGSEALKVAGVQGVANYLSAETFQSSPAQPLPAGYEAVIDSIQQAIQSDPRVNGKIQASFMPPDPRSPPLGGGEGTIRLGGRVADDDSYTAAMNDALKMTDLGVAATLVKPGHSAYINWMDPEPPAWIGPAAPDKPIIPLCPGLTIVTAVASPNGDYESIKTIESADGNQTRLKYSAEWMQPWWEAPHPPLNHMITHRTILASDLQSAHTYDQIFVSDEKSPETVRGTTAIGTSAAVLRELKTKGESELGLCGAAEDVLIMGKDGKTHPAPGGCYNFISPTPTKRVGNEPVRLRVLVNGVPTDLPAVQAQGEFPGEDRNEFFFLDDERNPLTLKFRLGIGGVPALRPRQRESCNNARTKGEYFSVRGDAPPSCDLPEGGDRDVLRVVKITADCSIPGAKPSSGATPSNGVAALEQSLAQSGKVDIYSVYFSFNSDVIRNESEPTLNEIAEVLRRHRDWRLRIAGHTDGIGGDEQNLDLSRRRAAAVKDALVKKQGIAASRLETTGFGKSQPKDTNDTLEGRARNRRVELMRIS
jgi:outer membrane protein OmpA-like peptidoglycan-associated protein/osmotically-inducible protein OsmY